MHKDHDTIQAIAQGDSQAFRKLYARYSDKVYNTALSYTQNQHDAEEITQDVFVKIHRYAAKFKGASSVNTWIYRITVNTTLNAIKKKKSRSFLGLGQVESTPTDFEHPGILLEKQEDAKQMFKAIDGLNEKQKTAFILSFIEDLPRQEVADIMGLSLKATESLLQRAKQKLRQKLEKMYPHRRKK